MALEISLNLFFFPDLLMTLEALNSKYLLIFLFDDERFCDCSSHSLSCDQL